MEEILEFIGRAAAVLAFIGAVALTLLELDMLDVFSGLQSVAHVFRIII